MHNSCVLQKYSQSFWIAEPKGLGLFSRQLRKRQWFTDFRDLCCCRCSSHSAQRHSGERNYFLKPKKIYTFTTQIRHCLYHAVPPAARGRQPLGKEFARQGSLHWEAVLTLLEFQIWNLVNDFNPSVDVAWGFLCPLPQKATERIWERSTFQRIRPNLAKVFLCFKDLQPGSLEKSQKYEYN